jgi:23S rRNA (cytosine1962-C5)-methyltransferase
LNTSLINRILKNKKQLKSFIKQENITCYRIFDWDMPEFPLCIDVYNNHLHIAEYFTKHNYDEEHNQWLSSCITDVQNILNIDASNVYVKRRERHRQDTHYKKVDTTKQEIIVEENGMKFIVNLSDYVDTGLFLDHRPVRKMAMQESKNKHVLNLFSYTGAFTVYMAKGGAASTTTADLSATYLNWAKRNMQLNGFEGSQHTYVNTDVKAWIKNGPKQKFDIVILDPPTLSVSDKAASSFNVQHDHLELINHSLQHIVDGGVLYFSNNFRNFILNEKEIQATSIEDITLKSIPPDFRNKKIHACWKIIK